MENSIAVISFENQTGDQTLDGYREIIPSRLITSLEQSQSFYVMSAERQKDLLKQVGKPGLKIIDSDAGFEVCRKEGVKALVTGSFYKAGDTFFTDVKVLDVRTKRLLRTAKTQGEGPQSLFIGQVDELSRKIAAGLGVAKDKIDASIKSIGDVSTTSEKAYEYYLQGSECYNNWDFIKARESLQKAVEIDPEFAMAYFLLSGANFEGVADRPAAIRALERAHALSKNVTEKERLQIETLYAYQIEKNQDKFDCLNQGVCGQVSQGEGGSPQTWKYILRVGAGKGHRGVPYRAASRPQLWSATEHARVSVFEAEGILQSSGVLATVYDRRAGESQRAGFPGLRLLPRREGRRGQGHPP